MEITMRCFQEWLSELYSRVERFLSASIKPSKPVIFSAFEKLRSSRGNSRSGMFLFFSCFTCFCDFYVVTT